MIGRNPASSATMQMLIDFEKADSLSIEGREALKILQKETQAIKETDEIFSHHQYPSHSITFGQLTSSTDFPILAISDYNSDAVHVFIALCNNCRNKDGCVQVKLDIIKEATGISKPSVRKALATLVSYGYIAIHSHATPKQSAIYMINPEIYLIGKQRTSYYFWELAGDEAKKNYEEMLACYETYGYVLEDIKKSDQEYGRTIWRHENSRELGKRLERNEEKHKNI